MNVKTAQKTRASARWWGYNRKYYAEWFCARFREKAKEYDAFFNPTAS